MDGRDLVSGRAPGRIVPGDPPRRDLEHESLDVWGFRDTAFQVRPDETVVLTGSRYELSGAVLPDLLPWTRETLGVDLRHDGVHVSD